MKKLLYILTLSVILFSCGSPKKKVTLPPLKYKVGDVVYLKLDSTKCIVSFVHDEWLREIREYELKYKTGKGEYKEIDVLEGEIFQETMYDY
jgi:hypothetical protein